MGLITRNIDHAYLAFDPGEEAPIHGLLGSSTTYRIATGTREGKIERLARYVSRPPVATERLSLTRRGNVRYALKTPYRAGTTHVIFEPEDFIARL